MMVSVCVKIGVKCPGAYHPPVCNHAKLSNRKPATYTVYHWNTDEMDFFSMFRKFSSPGV